MRLHKTSIIPNVNELTTVLTYSDRVDHDRHLRNTPAHDDCAYGQLILERRSQDKETTEIQRNRNVTSPVNRGQDVRTLACKKIGSSAHQRRVSASKTPLFFLIPLFMIHSFAYRPINSPIMTATWMVRKRAFGARTIDIVVI